MSVNDKWHYCHNSEVLVGSRAMRDRHLRLLGYVILQVGHAHGAPLGPVRLSEFMRESVGHLGSFMKSRSNGSGSTQTASQSPFVT